MRRVSPLLLPLLAGCFFGHDHDHGHGGHGHEQEPLPEKITAENAASVLDQCLRRLSASSLGEGAVYRAWKTEKDGRPVVSGIEKRSARSGLDGAWTRILFQKIRSVEVVPPAQAGLKLWGVSFSGETYFGAGEAPEGMTATPFTIVSSDGAAVKGLAASVDLLRRK